VDLSISSEVRGEATVVHVGGEIDVYTAPLLREHLDEHISAGRTDLVVDLGSVTFMASTGLGVGTTAPTTTLQVVGTLTANSAGLGTTSPANELDVTGNDGGVAGIRFNNAVPSNNSLTLYSNGSTLMWGNSAAQTPSPTQATPSAMAISLSLPPANWLPYFAAPKRFSNGLTTRSSILCTLPFRIPMGSPKKASRPSTNLCAWPGAPVRKP